VHLQLLSWQQTGFKSGSEPGLPLATALCTATCTVQLLWLGFNRRLDKQHQHYKCHVCMCVQDLDLRKKRRAAEFVWRGSPAYGSASDLFVSQSPNGIYSIPYEHHWTIAEPPYDNQNPDATLVSCMAAD
jgi:hypothetical protein